MKDYHRIKFVDLCQQIDDCDAGFHRCTLPPEDVCKIIMNKYGKDFVPMSSQSKYKLIVDIDGNTYSERFSYLLTTGSAILKIGIFLDIGFVTAKPWIHYIPAKMDMTDLEEKIKWAK